MRPLILVVLALFVVGAVVGIAYDTAPTYEYGVMDGAR
jgi:hypothetical protein